MHRRRIAPPHTLLGAMLALLLASVSLAVAWGAVEIPAATVWAIALAKLWPGAVTEHWPPGQGRIIWELRFPRVILAALVGSGLALVGATLQALTRNRLADPHLLGISSGAVLGAVLVMMHLGPLLGPLTLPLGAFLGSLLALALVLGAARRQGRMSGESLILAGVAVGFVLMALANLLTFLGDHRAAHQVVFWMLGGLGLARWDLLPLPSLVLLAGMAVLLLHARQLNVLASGEDTAASLGLDVQRLRLGLFVTASLVTGVMVSVSGAIGFVGLMVPHIARLLVGADHRRVLPFAALLGAVFLIWVDVLARTLLRPEDLPIGIVTGFAGGVFFLWLMGRREHRH